MTLSPDIRQVLLIEDHPDDGDIARRMLEQHAVHVTWVRDILAGWSWAIRHLSTTQPRRPMVILLDMKMPDPVYPQLEGSVLASWLTEEMRATRLHMVPILGYTSDWTSERSWEARAAGCTDLVEKPMSREVIQRVLTLEPTLPPDLDDPGKSILRKNHIHILNMIVRLRYQPPTISAGVVRALLSCVTPALYGGRLPDHDVAKANHLFTALGGPISTISYLRRYFHVLDDRQTQIMTALLNQDTQGRIQAAVGLRRKPFERALSSALYTSS